MFLPCIHRMSRMNRCTCVSCRYNACIYTDTFVRHNMFYLYVNNLKLVCNLSASWQLMFENKIMNDAARWELRVLLGLFMNICCVFFVPSRTSPTVWCKLRITLGSMLGNSRVVATGVILVVAALSTLGFVMRGPSVSLA